MRAEHRLSRYNDVAQAMDYMLKRWATVKEPRCGFGSSPSWSLFAVVAVAVLTLPELRGTVLSEIVPPFCHFAAGQSPALVILALEESRRAWLDARRPPVSRRRGPAATMGASAETLDEGTLMPGRV
jgi:hypothetical protein